MELKEKNRLKKIKQKKKVQKTEIEKEEMNIFEFINNKLSKSKI
jgi:hypothetical protein